MGISHAAITHAVRRDANVKFLDGLASDIQTSPLTQFVTDFTTNKSQLIAGWAGAPPSPRRRDGQVVHRSWKFYEHTVTPVDWENTGDIDVSTYNDAKGVGVVIDMAGKVGAKNARHQLVRAVQVLEAGTGTSVATCYDGVAFFSDSHPESGSNQDNSFTSMAATGTTPTPQELESAIDAMVVAMMGYTDDQGDIYDLDSTNFTFVFPRQYWTPAHKVLGGNGTVGGSPASPMGVQTTDANDTLPTGVFRGQYEYYFEPLLSNSDRFYAFRKPRAGNTVSALAFNLREPWQFLLKTGENSDYAIDNNVIWYTSKARYDVGYGDWRSAAVHIFT